MVSYETLGSIKRTDDTEVYFGGLSIIAVGDFYQLPLFVTDLCFKTAGYMCKHLHIYGGPIHYGETPYQYATEK